MTASLTLSLTLPSGRIYFPHYMLCVSLLPSLPPLSLPPSLIPPSLSPLPPSLPPSLPLLSLSPSLPQAMLTLLEVRDFELAQLRANFSPTAKQKLASLSNPPAHQWPKFSPEDIQKNREEIVKLSERIALLEQHCRDSINQVHPHSLTYSLSHTHTHTHTCTHACMQSLLHTHTAHRATG